MRGEESLGCRFKAQTCQNCKVTAVVLSSLSVSAGEKLHQLQPLNYKPLTTTGEKVVK